MKCVGNGGWESIVAAVMFVSFSMICFCYLLVLFLFLNTALFIASQDTFECHSFHIEDTYQAAADFKNIVYRSIYIDN